MVLNRLHSFLQSPGTLSRLLWFGALFRLGALLFSGRWQTTEYWEYGPLAESILAGRGYQFPFVDEHLQFTNAWYPSALMPPGYVFFLLPFFLIQDLFWRNLLLFSTQIALSILSLYSLHRWVKANISLPVAHLSVLLLAVLPEMVFAPLTVGPTVWFHLLMALFLGFASGPPYRFQTLTLVLVAATMVYFRSEALLFFGLFAFWLAKQRKIRMAFSLVVGLGLLLLPWMWRNHNELGTWTLSNNLGVNLFRGNNAGALGDWPGQWWPEVVQFRQLPATYERRYDRWALQKSLTWMQENPAAALGRIPEKLAKFWLLDWSDPRSRSPFIWAFWLPMLVAGAVGWYRHPPSGMEPLVILLLSYTLVMVIFFPQLRYQTMARFFFIPFSAGTLVHWISGKGKSQ